MTNNELRDFLYNEIPLCRFMEIEILRADDEKVEVLGPLGPSRNHLETAFGGSIGAIMIVSCYAWLFHKLKSHGFDCHVLIKEGHTDYHLPVKEDLKAICIPPEAADYEKFLTTFERKGLSKIPLTAFITTKEGKAATFTGVFVAQKTKHA